MAIATSEQNWQNFLQENYLVFATSKLSTFEQALVAWRLFSNGGATLRDPQRSITPVEYEPRSDDPRDATHFKITRVEKTIDEIPQKEKALVVGTDVVFGMKLPGQSPQFFHKLERLPDETLEDHKARIKPILGERYAAEQFQAFWKVAVGAGKMKRAPNIGTLTVEAEQSFLTPREIEQYLAADSNAGLKMIELAIDRGANLMVHLEGEREPILFDEPQEKEVLRQLIATKLPTREMLMALSATLQRAEMQAHPERYGQFQIARTHLLAS